MTTVAEPTPEGPEDGPFFDDLHVGLRCETAPAMTLSSGNAALHQAILGDRLRLALDARLGPQVTGQPGVPAHPALVWDVAIGQSTLLTRRVRANLFYRGLAFRRFPRLGDTLRTTTEVVALRQNQPRQSRAATGMAVLRVATTDQEGRPVLDFWRCAMLPLSDPHGDTGHADGFDGIPSTLDDRAVTQAIDGWKLGPVASSADQPRFADLKLGRRWRLTTGDVVSSAPELARLTLNVAAAHHDRTIAGDRLVYGGHTIGIAASHLARLFPTLVTVTAWHSCEHTAPVHEGDTLFSEVVLEQTQPLPGIGGLVHLRSMVHAVPAGGREPAQVLDWRLVAVVA